MAEIDVAKQWKAYIVSALWYDANPHGSEYVAPRMWKYAEGRQPLP